MKNIKQIKLIISVLIVVGIIIGGYALYKNKQKSLIGGNIDTATLNSDTALAVPSDAWNVFELYISYLKNHDVEKLKTVVSEKILEQNPNCPMRQVQVGISCDSLMDLAYKEGVKLNQVDFVNSWEDGKQIILSTNVTKKDSTMPNSENYGKYYIFFTKDKDGNPKVLNFSGIVTTFVYTDISKISAKQKSDDVTKSFADLDQDGLLDRNENCKTSKDQVASPYNKNCSNTSSQKRDSLGDGVWDGIRVFFGNPTAKKSS